MRLHRQKWLWVLVAAVLCMGGCKDFNETFKNNTNRQMTRLIVTVKIKGATRFPRTTGWYNNHPPGRVDGPTGPDAEGYYTYQLTWIFFPPIQPGDSVHVGGTFKDDQDMKLVSYKFTFFNQEEADRVSGLSMKPRLDPQQGLVVDAFNASDQGAITVQRLDWTAHDQYIPLENLDWTDPTLNLLPWEPVTGSLPFDLAPGDVLTFDVPDSALAGKTHALVRWIVIDDQGLVSQEPVFEIPVSALPGSGGVIVGPIDPQN
ncbi:MAG TPA: hypothetical protein VF789_15520 [Thermoanaerobaculia bacterium]